MEVRSVVRQEDQICCYRSITSSGVRALWEIVRTCNLRCSYCLVPDGSRGLPLSETRRIARELLEAGIGKVLISGGEPMLYKPLPTIIKQLVESGALVKLLTNGTVYREDVFQLFDRHPRLELSTSLEAADADTNDEIFGRSGTHARIMRLFDRVKGSRIHVNAVCSALNCGKIADLIDWTAARGAGSISLINIFQSPGVSGRFESDCRVHSLSAEERSRLMDLVREKRAQHYGRTVIRTLNFQRAACETCDAGRSIIYIDAFGRILPCTLTDNAPYVDASRGRTVAQMLDWFKDRVPALPASSCSAALRLGGGQGAHA